MYDYLPLKNTEHISSHLNLDLQTGAFLQFILTLTAITSRMAILLTEIGPVAANAWTSCFKLLTVLDASVFFSGDLPQIAKESNLA